MNLKNLADLQIQSRYEVQASVRYWDFISLNHVPAKFSHCATNCTLGVLLFQFDNCLSY